MPKIIYEPPKLIAVAGPPAVGKTELAKGLARRIACAYFRRGYTILDVFDEFEAPVERTVASAPPLDYARRADIAFEIFYRYAEENLGLGNTVILDTPFNNIKRGMHDERLDGIVARYNPDFRLYICTAPDEVIKERMATREGGKPRPSDEAKLADWERYATRMHRMGEVQYPYILLNTTKPVEENVERMLEELGS